MSIALSGPRLAPASGKAKSLVVFLHGYGADGHDLIDIGRMWSGLMPDTAFASPHAPDPHPEAPQGRQWFPLASIDFRTIDLGVRQAAPILDAFLDAELARYGLGDDRLALVGFSQGTMLAFEAGPRRKGKIAGIIGYSGMLSGVERLDKAPHRPPILLVHGGADQLVPVIAVHAAAQALGQAGFPVEWHVSPMLGHGIDEEGLRLGANFLKRVLG
ncbi:MAG TPA: dienelactone hydrolase family protein [Bauldia sp.]|nr:dienelactone hydrolase family protein [Bauldia sp.]